MSSEQKDLDRNEQATPFKLQEAKKRGASAKSTDATSLGVILVATVACFALAAAALRQMAQLLSSSLAVSAQALSTSEKASAFVGGQFLAALHILAPLLFVLVTVVILLGWLQTGGIFSSQPLKPDWTKLNPVTGLKRFFTLKLLYEAGKSLLKLAALAGVTYVALKAMAPGATRLLALPTRGVILELVNGAGSLAAKLCAVLALFTLIDLVFTRWDFLRNMRMSRREQEDEHKHREGDPRIKNRLRELRQQFLQRTQAVAKVPTANVLITNPTHFAVALRYEHGKSPAPQIVAKGAGRLAGRMREVAYRSQVPIVHNPVLARALFKEAALDSYVPEKWYPQVAKILVWLQAARRSQAAAIQPAQGAVQ